MDTEVVKRKRVGPFATMSYTAYAQKLRAVCTARNFSLTKLGAVGRTKRFPLYAVILNSKVTEKSVCISAGIHGSEESGPLAVLDFLKEARPRTFRRTKVILFPCVNPTGFNAHERANDRGYDLNRRFARKYPEENKLVYYALQPDLQARRLVFSISLHEDDAREIYFHAYGKGGEKIYRRLLREQSGYFPILTAMSRYHYPMNKGLSFDFRDGSLDDRLSLDGAPYSMSVETPTLYPIHHMIAAQKKLMTSVIALVDRELGLTERGLKRALAARFMGVLTVRRKT